MQAVRQWLSSIGLGMHADAFAAAEIDMDVLAEIEDADLKELGLPLGHRRRFLKAARDRGAQPVPTPRHLAERILTSRASIEGERKQVTVLFADVAGFTALSESMDPEEVHQIMDGCYALIGEQVHRYEGTVNLYAGDGVMALFGAPIAHEDHARRAAHAALGIQEALGPYAASVEARSGRAFAMRIGLNTGLVVVGRIGDDLKMDYTALGDTVNLAARLEHLASPGQIFASDATRRLVGQGFAWIDVGDRRVKGKAVPVRVHRLAGGPHDPLGADGPTRRQLAPLVGRQEEMEALERAWTQARSGTGRVVSIVGEAGIGKSRLLFEYRRRLLDSGGRCVEGTCFTYGEGISFLPFLRVVRSLCGIGDDHDEASAKAAIDVALRRLGLRPDAAPILHNLLSYDVEDPRFFHLTPELVRRRTVETLVELLTAAAGEAPLAVVIEDVHWIDKATEEVIGSLVDVLERHRLLLVLVYRPDYLNQWSERTQHAEVLLRKLPSASSVALVRAVLARPYAATLALAPLSGDESLALARRLAGDTAVPAVLERLILERTEGNPLFVEELTSALAESGALDSATVGEATAVAGRELPATIQGVFLARVDRLPDELKETLRAAAAIGRVFSPAILARVLPVEAPVEELLLRLQDLGFVYPAHLGSGGDYSFKHVLAQEAVYSTLVKSARVAYHEAIGAAIEDVHADRLEELAEVLARHYREAGNAAKAVRHLATANEKAVRANAVLEAYEYFTEARRLFETLPATEPNLDLYIGMLCGNVIVFQLLFRYQEYYALLQAALPLARALPSPEREGHVLTRMGHMEWAFAELSAAALSGRRAVEILEPRGTAEDLGYAQMMLGWIQLVRGEFDEIETSERRALTSLAGGVNLRWHVWTLSFASLGYAWMGRFPQSIERAGRALAAAEEYDDISLISFASWVLGTAHASRGDMPAARVHGARAVAVASTPSDRSWAGATNAWFMCHTGESDEGIRILEEAVGANRAAGFIWSEVMASHLAEGYLVAGRFDEARRTAVDVGAFCRRTGMAMFDGVSSRLLGDVERASGGPSGPEAARRLYRNALDTFERIGARAERAHTLAALGRLHVRSGEGEVGRSLLEEADREYAALRHVAAERLMLSGPSSSPAPP